MPLDPEISRYLQEKARITRRETIRLHGLSPEVRVASSLSDVEIFVCLYYGKILRFNPNEIGWENRDRFILSKGHGGVSLYPILADLGYFPKENIETISQPGSCFGSIPDCAIAGIETINGSLGHGLGVAAGIALALTLKAVDAKVFVLLGDGELNEGSIWEATMFAAHNKLGNLIAIVDSNKISMLDYCNRILDIDPVSDKFKQFGWSAHIVDGHNVDALWETLDNFKNSSPLTPKVLIANTVKAKGIPQLEGDSLCHIKSLSKENVEELIRKMQ